MNYMPEIAKMLGVEIGEEFKLRPYDKNEVTFSYYLFKRDGLYNPTQEAVDLAHQYDRKLGLSPIKVLGTIKK